VKAAIENKQSRNPPAERSSQDRILSWKRDLSLGRIGAAKSNGNSPLMKMVKMERNSRSDIFTAECGC
jgi:hypothetical protein